MPKGKSLEEDVRQHSSQARPCIVCRRDFTPPNNPGALSTGDNHLTHCAKCRRAIKDATLHIDAPMDEGALHDGPGAPIRQIIFDLETWGLDRGWGVTLVASFMIHGGDGGTKRITLKHRDSKAWRSGRRSDDREMAEEVFKIFTPGCIAYAHNGDRFDVKWLRTVALRYELQMPRIKLIDPCAIAWKRYRLGRNSLEALADFLKISDDEAGQKVHLSPDVWREALMDDDDAAWADLVKRCESDVLILNKIASKVTGDVGLIDYQGSWR
jgi:hypothetical protein